MAIYKRADGSTWETSEDLPRILYSCGMWYADYQERWIKATTIRELTVYWHWLVEQLS